MKFGADRTLYGISMVKNHFFQAAKDTPFNENSRSSQFNIAKALSRMTIYNADVIKFLGGVCYSIQHDTSFFQQVALCVYAFVQKSTLIKHVKFGADRTLYA